MDYQLVRSSRKTLAIEIRQGQVIVKAPNRMSKWEIERFLAQKQDWIEKCLQKHESAVENAGGKLTEEQMETLRELAKDRFRQAVAYYAPLVGVSYGRITVRCQKTRWGSCSKDGNLNFNAALMLAPAEVLESVVVHELCHRKEMNHSERFYAEVTRVMPDYHARHKWLKENGEALLLRLP